MKTQILKSIKLQSSATVSASATVGNSAMYVITSLSNSDKNCNPYKEPSLCITLQDSQSQTLAFTILSPEEAEFLSKSIQALLKAQRITEDPNTINDQSDVLI